MNYTTFAQLWREAHEYTDFDLYVLERCWQDWMDEYADRSDTAVADTLTRIWDMAREGTNAMRRMLDSSQIAFAKYFGIPRRTIENWESGTSVPPQYIISLLAFAVLSILDAKDAAEY